jgi:hypothetical protein
MTAKEIYALKELLLDDNNIFHSLCRQFIVDLHGLYREKKFRANIDIYSLAKNTDK